MLFNIYLFSILLCTFVFVFKLYNYSKLSKYKFKKGIIFPFIMLGIVNFIFLFIYMFSNIPSIMLIYIFCGFSVWITMIWFLLIIIKIEK